MHFDAEAKRAKALKIVQLLAQHHRLEGARILDIGTGIGVIASVLADAAGADGSVVSIDTMDTRVGTAGYRFELTSGVELPFDDGSFDVVVSNHVVEHVGARNDQELHLTEMRRVLADDGIGYLATPTRWALIEPHFKLPLLSWLPAGMRNRYVATARKGTVYDVLPFGPQGLHKALSSAGLRYRNVTLDALDVMLATESRRPLVRLLKRAPKWLLRLASPTIPTMVYVVSAQPGP
jgi:ubiquinone/menaquinone biosynthesis C-methylase UbiE